MYKKQGSQKINPSFEIVSSKGKSMSDFPFFQKTEYSFNVVKNEKHNRIEVHIRGILPSPEDLGEPFTHLYNLAEEFSNCIVYLNTPGGDGNSMIELFSVLRKFKNIVTVGLGEISSAGAMLWCIGNIRVISEYTSVMFHRESYGWGGKTDQHLDLANHTSKIYSKLCKDIFDGILTDEEVEKTKYTEVYLSADDLIERGVAISWDDFKKYDLEEPQIIQMIMVDDKQYQVMDEENLIYVDDNNQTYVVNLFDVMYRVKNPRCMSLEDDSVLEGVEGNGEDSEEEPDIEQDASAVKKAVSKRRKKA